MRNLRLFAVIATTLAFGQTRAQTEEEEGTPGTTETHVEFLAGTSEDYFSAPLLGLVESDSLGANVATTSPGLEKSPELTELAKGLGYDPLKIFSYVRHEIDSELYFGLKKGPRMTFLEESGNDLDKACLLMTLLQIANEKLGGSASVVLAHGQQAIPYSVGDGLTPDICSLWDLEPGAMSTNPSGTGTIENYYSNQTPYIDPALASHVGDVDWRRISLAFRHAMNSGYGNDSRITVPTSSSSLTIRRFFVKLSGFPGSPGTFLLDPWFVRYNRTVPALALSSTPGVTPGLKLTTPDLMVPGGNGNTAKLWIPTSFTQRDWYESNLVVKMKESAAEVLAAVKKPENLGALTCDAIFGSRKMVRKSYANLGEAAVSGQTTATATAAGVSRNLAWRLDLTLADSTSVMAYLPSLAGRRISVITDDSTGPVNFKMSLGIENKIFGSDFSIQEVASKALGSTKLSTTLTTKVLMPFRALTGESPATLANFGPLPTSTATYERNNEMAQNQRVVNAVIYGFNPAGGHLRSRQARLDEILQVAEMNYPGSTTGVTLDWSKLPENAATELGLLRQYIVLESLNVKGLDWLYQTALVRKRTGDVFRTNLTKSISLGRMTQKLGYFIDIYQQLTASVNRYGNFNEPGGEMAASYAAMLLESALEHSVIEQADSSARIYSGAIWRPEGASTVNILKIGGQANLIGAPAFGVVVRERSGTTYLNTPPHEQIRPNVGTATGLDIDVSTFEPFFTQQSALDSKPWAPPPIALAVLKGNSKFFAGPGGTSPVNFVGGAFLSAGSIQMKVGAGNGGYSIANEPLEVSFLQEDETSNPGYFEWSSAAKLIDVSQPSYEKLELFGADPVNVASGSFEHAEIDLVLGSGEAPTGLSFKRDYTSSRARQDLSALGFGWTHNWDIRLIEHTNAPAGLGSTIPRHMTPLFASLHEMKAYLIPPKKGSGYQGYDDESINPKRWMIVSGIAKWCADQITNNAVTVTMGNESETFVKTASGAYEAGAGSKMEFSMSATGEGTLKQRHGNVIEFKGLYSSSYGYRRGRATKITGPNGQEVTLTWGANGVTQVSSALGKLVFTYDSTGSKHLTSVAETIGSSATRQVVFTQSGGNLISATDPENAVPAQSSMSGGATIYGYAPSKGSTVNCCLDWIRDPMGRDVVRNIYDAFGRVESQDSGVIEMAGSTLLKPWKFRYAGIQTEEQDPLGGVKRYHFDDIGRLYRQEDALGYATDTSFDAEDRIVKTVDPRGARIETQYDVWSNPVSISEYRNSTSTVPYVTLSTFNPWPDLRPATSTDALGRVTLFRYPGGVITNPALQISADPAEVEKNGKIATFAYVTTGFAKGKIASVSDENGVAVSYTYDALGNLLTQTEPGGYTITNGNYTPQGDAQKITDQNGRDDLYVFNKRRQVIGHTRTDPATPTYAISETKLQDAAGRLAFESVATGRSGGANVKSYEYLSSGKPTTTRFGGADGVLWTPDDTFELTVYDEREWPVSKRDVSGNVAETIYLANGWTQDQTLPADPKLGARTITAAYDASGREVSSTDVLGRTSTTTYAEQATGPLQGGVTITGDRTTSKDPGNFTVKRLEDAGGNLRSIEDARGKIYQMNYDLWDRLTKTITPEGRFLETQYLADGRVSLVKEGDGTSQVSTQTVFQAGSRRTAALWRTPGPITYFNSYDSKGNLLSATENSKTITRTYDYFDRVRTYKNADGWMIGYEYYSDGMLKRIYYPDSATDTNPFDNDSVLYNYDQQGRLKTITDWASRVTTYNWRTDGRLGSIVRPNGTVRQLNYDTLSRVVGFTDRTSTGDLIMVQRLDYRKTDDLASTFTHPRPPSGSLTTPASLVSATFGDDNSLATVNVSGTSRTLTTDKQGNLTSAVLDSSGAPATLSFDERSRLTGVSAAVATTYSYDLEGNRTSMTHAGATTNYVFDPNGGALVRMLVKIDSTGKKTRYVYGFGLDYEVDQTTGQPSYYHYDFSGNTVALTNAAGTITNRFFYTPYGQKVYSTGTSDTPFKFGGFLGIISDPNGLVSMRARFYSPVLCRFVSMDPAKFEGGTNWYAYANGNPMTLGDPSGFGAESTLDAVQTGLSVLGMLPVVGAAFDLMNAGISVVRGNYADAAINAFAAIPGIGDMAGGAKLGMAALKGADRAADLAKPFASLGGGAGWFSRGSTSVGDIVKALDGVTAQSTRVAAGIKSGAIQVEILSKWGYIKAAWKAQDAEFAFGTRAFAHENRIYLQGSRTQGIFGDAVHEGTHALDFLSGATRSKTRPMIEVRAWSAELQFNRATGAFSEANSYLGVRRIVRERYR